MNIKSYSLIIISLTPTTLLSLWLSACFAVKKLDADLLPLLAAFKQSARLAYLIMSQKT